VAALGEVERQIVFRARDLDRDLLRANALPIRGGSGGAVEHQHRLHERRLAEAALRPQLLDDALEPHLLMRPRVEACLPAAGSPAVPPGSNRTRIARVLTKKPISPSSSTRRRLEAGDPTSRSSAPV